MEITCTTFPDLCSCSGRLMECFVLKELVVGMFNKESVRLSCQLLSAIHKLSKLVESKDGKMAKVSRCFIFIQIDCHNHHFCGKREMPFRFWDDCSLVHGNCCSLNSHVIPMSVQLQCIQDVSITVHLSLAEISPELVVLSNELIRLLLRDIPCPSVLLSLFHIARTSLSSFLC